ncbi:MAG: flagellar biosynthetic protein FliR [bacterium]
MTVSLLQFSSFISELLFNTLRVAGFFMVVPIFGNQLVSPRIRIALSMAVGLALTPVMGDAPNIADFNLSTMVDLVLQILLAIGLGFSAVIFFQLFVIAGQFIGMQMGLGFAAMVDPGNGVSVTVWSQFFLMLVTLSFLVLNGHLVLFEIFVTGFKLYPNGMALGMGEFAGRIAQLGGWMFAGGVLLAIPAVISLLIVNMSFGVMNRSAPQLNVFSLGFPFSLLFGLVIIWFVLHGWADQFHRLATEFLDIASGLSQV